METRLINKTLIVLVLLFIGYGVTLAHFSLSGFPRNITFDYPFPYLSDKPVGEDGFYMLTVAWDIAHGEGFTYNFRQPTTGVQPLNTMVEAGVAWLIQISGGDKWDFVRSAILLGLFYMLLFSFLIGKIAVDLVPDNQMNMGFIFSFAFIYTLFNYGLFRIFTYGLETGLYLVLVACNVLFTMRWLDNPISFRTMMGFGMLSGLTILARIDYCLILGIFLVFALVRRQLSIKNVLTTLLTTAVVTGFWFYYVFEKTGSIIPSSGFAQARVISSAQLGTRVVEMIRALISHLVPWIYSRPNLFLSVVAGIFLIVIGIALFYNQSTRRFARTIIHHQPFYPNWFFATLILLPIYFFAFEATHFYYRYIAPIQVMVIPFIATLLVYALRNVQIKLKLGLIMLISLCFFLWTSITMHTGVVTNPQPILAGYVQSHLPETAKIGAFQSGVLGYFNSNVVNLDGKVNQEALEFQKNGNLENYLDQVKISVLLDWPEIIQKKLPAKYLTGFWQPCPDPVPDSRSICLMRRDQE